MKQGSSVPGWTLYTDGSACTKSQRAAIGFVLYESLDTEPVKRAGKAIGYETSHAIEYRAVLRGLEEAYRCGARTIEVRSDLRTMVDQLNGKSKVKAVHLKPIFEDVQKQIARFTQVRVVYVERTANTLADELARTALKQKPPGTLRHDVEPVPLAPTETEIAPEVVPSPPRPQQFWKPIGNELCVWNLEKLWSTVDKVPQEKVAITELAHLLDTPGWFGDQPLTLRRVAELAYQTVNADLDKPLLLCDTELLDGRFRLASAVCSGRREIGVKRLKQLPAPDLRYPLRYAP